MEKKSEEQIISDVLGDYDKALNAESLLYYEQKKDMQYYLGKQWDDNVKTALEAEMRPVLTINLSKKNVDAVSGYERQNRMDIKTFPIEGGDEVVAEAISRVIKIVTTNNNTSYLRSRAFKDASISGLGWLGAYMNFDKDFMFGDISFEHIPFNEMLFDPNMKNPDLSDCMYIIRHKKIDRNVLADIYKNKEKEILACKNDEKTDSRSIKIQNEKTEGTLSVIEKWFIEYRKQKIVVDPKGTSMIFTGAEEELDVMIRKNPELSVVSRRVRVISLQTVVGHTILAYDGPNPYGLTMYPFIPYFFYFDPSYNESDAWSLKVQGIVRCTRDPQDEKNKQRSALQEAVSKSVHSSWMMEEGSVDDETTYENSAGSGHVLKYNRNRPAPQRVESPPVNADLFNMIAMNDNDFRLVGLNPDMIGQSGEKGMSGYLAQIRQKQGLSTLQEAFDNLSIANKLLGQVVIQLMGRFYSREKIKRLLGNDLPFPTDKQKQKQTQQLQQMEQQIEESVPQVQQQMEAIREENPEEAEQMMRQVMQDIQQKKMQIDKLKEMFILQEEAEADFWSAFSVITTGNILYDVAVAETTENPTYRLGAALILQQLIQSGIQVSPDLVIDLVDIPASVKKKHYEWQEQQMQMQQQAQQQQMQMEQARLQIEMAKAQAGMSGKIQGQMVQPPAEGGSQG